jgi:ketosteroid isomerase-like protein
VSAQNAETVRRWVEALSREDFDAALALVHPDVEFVPPGGQPPYRGAASLRRWMEPDALQGQVIEPLETIAVDSATVLVKHHVTARGTSSGIPLDVISWSVWKFDEAGLITRGQVFLEHEEDKAREAAGLRE